MSSLINQRPHIREVGGSEHEAMAADSNRDADEPLTFEDFLWFLNAVREGTSYARYRCAYCGHDAFTTFMAEGNPGAVKSTLAPTDNADHPEFHGVRCTKCGNTAFFADDVVREALAKRLRGAADKT